MSQGEVVGQAAVEHQAFLLAVLAQQPMPSARRRFGWAGPLTVLRTWTVPLSSRSRPNAARTISVRPAPTSPAMPRISPARSAERGGSGFGTAGELAKLEDGFADVVG
jgi:hypothetical protein